MANRRRDFDDEPRHRKQKKPRQQQPEINVRISPKTPGQRRYLDSINEKIVTICTGNAGTGKTWLACGLAASMLQRGQVSRIVIARPLVTCGNAMGFLPGGVGDKTGPYMMPMLDAFEDHLSLHIAKTYIGQRKIELLPLELMRGSSLKDAFVICDEAQNATHQQLKMLLTRFGINSKMVIVGDTKQHDHHGMESPLLGVARKLEGHQDIGIVALGREDIVRHPLIQWIDERLD